MIPNKRESEGLNQQYSGVFYFSEKYSLDSDILSKIGLSFSSFVLLNQYTYSPKLPRVPQRTSCLLRRVVYAII